MSQLRLAASVLAVDFVDALRLEAAIEDVVPLLAAGREAEAGFADLQHLCPCHERSTIGLHRISMMEQWTNGPRADLPCIS